MFLKFIYVVTCSFHKMFSYALILINKIKHMEIKCILQYINILIKEINLTMLKERLKEKLCRSCKIIHYIIYCILKVNLYTLIYKFKKSHIQCKIFYVII